jgi:hypothetical protein
MTGTSFIPIIVVIIIIAKTRKLVNRFKNSGAINERNAKTLEELKISRRFIFRKYLFHDVIIELNNKYYLNEQNLNDYRTKKRIILIPIVLIIILMSIFLDVTLT